MRYKGKDQLHSLVFTLRTVEMAGTQYESVVIVKNEVFVYKIPARTTNRGYRAADWTLDKPDWVGRLKIVAKSQDLTIRLEDKNSGELFAQCPVDGYPGTAVEQVLDSSRYFVIRIKDESGRSAFIGIGFADRGDSFDLLVAIQDHFKWLKREEERKTETVKGTSELDPGPKLDLGFKEGQTIKINLNTKRQGDEDSEAGASKPRSRAAGGGIGILPPPPGGAAKLVPPPRAPAAVAASPQHQPQQHNLDLLAGPQQTRTGASGTAGSSNVDLLMDLGAPPQSLSTGGATGTGFTPLQPSNAPANSDPWGDFASATGSSTSSSQPGSSDGNWVSFE